MSTQQDIYAAGFENRPLMLNKENYVPWSSRLLRYTKSRPNGKLIHNSIINGPYVRRMIPESGDLSHEVPVNETFHEVDDLRAERLAKTQDPLALMATSNNPYTFLVLHQDQPSFNQNYMQQPMPNLKDITDLTTAMNMTLSLMAKAFKLNYSTPSNNNQRISSNPRNRQIAQPGMNMGQTDLCRWSKAMNPNRNGNLVVARTEGNATRHNADLDEIEEVNANCILMANLQQASTSGTQIDKATVYDSDGSYEVHNYENCYDNEIFNMFTQEEQYIELLEPIPEPHQVPQNDNNVISEDTTRGTSANTKFEKQSILGKPPSSSNTKLYAVTPIPKSMIFPKVGETHALSKLVTSNSIPTPQESKVVKNDKVIASGMFRINPFKPSREEKCIPNKVRASIRTNPIIVSQPPVITKKVVNFDSNGLSSTRIDNTAKTRRPQPRSNTKNDRVPSASKSSCSKNKEVECLISVNHDVCLLNYVNDMNSRGKKQKENVSINENQKKQTPKVKKPTNVGSNERLATPKPSKPRFFLRWSPTGRFFDLKGKIIASTASESQFVSSNGDNACTSNPLEPKIKRFPNSTSFLGRLSNFVHGFSDLQWGNILITRVYFVEGLGHNLFSVRKFCDSGLEVAFRRNTCFVRNLEGVDLLKGNRTANLYTINLYEMASVSLIFLMARVTSIKSWLWHQRLSHLNFDTIYDLVKNDLVTGLPKFKYQKEHHCPSLERRNRTLAEAARTMLIFSRAPLFLWAKAIATACFTQNRSIVHRRFHKIPYELINGRKPDISFLHVFRALCYPKNDRKDIRKLGAKGDIGFFIGYSVDSCAYRVFNRRTKKIIETMNVSFDELSAMDFDQSSSKPRLQSMTSGQIGLGLDLTYALSTITTQQPTEGELDLLFKAMYDDYIGGQLSAALRTISATQAHQVGYTQLFFDLMKSRFEMSMMGEMTFFLGLQVNQSPCGIFINQSIYMLEILKKYGMESCDAVGTPMEIKDKFDLVQNETPVDVTKYRSMIGALMYLTFSRPYIVHATCLCAWYQAKPAEKHLKEVKRIFRYI
uniref:Uncharacterized protein n=1 Tax=Tanacetum cinerariifolium TaxID=118510 RepID=A0A699HG00_TANCI|nr:hypothetical protein [Tanacetum cinerariifolium]